MDYNEQLNLIKKMLTKCHLNTQIINIDISINEQIDLGFRKLFLKEGETKSFKDLFCDIKSNTIYRAKNIFLCRYIFLKLPYKNENLVLLIGPYLNIDISHDQIIELVESLKMPPKIIKDLELYYSSIPNIKEENSIYAIISSFAEYIWNEENNFEYVDINIDNSPVFSNIQFNKKNNFNESLFNIQSIEKRYEYENDIMSAVKHGNIHKAEFLISSFPSLSFEKRVTNELRNIKNYFIIINTLLRKAAEQGGVHPMNIDTVSSQFAYDIETLSSVSKSYELMQKMLQTYCRLVKNNNIKNYSPLIQKAIVYIDNDITNDLSLNAISKMSNVSLAYFSNLFKKETGITLTQYVNNARVKLAKHLLRNSNLQIQTIAQHCGILDLNYFCRVFKKVTGKTPSEYRNGLSIN